MLLYLIFRRALRRNVELGDIECFGICLALRARGRSMLRPYGPHERGMVINTTPPQTGLQRPHDHDHQQQEVEGVK